MFDNHRKIIRHLKAFQAKIKFLICYGIPITKMIIMGTNIRDFEYINRAISALAATWIFSCVIFWTHPCVFITPPLSLFSSSSTCCCQFLIACSHFCNSASYRLNWLTWDRLDSGSWRGVSGPSLLFSFNFSNWMFALLKGFWKVKWSLHRNTSQWHLPIRLYAMLKAVMFPAGISRLNTSLANMDRNTFPHFGVA